MATRNRPPLPYLPLASAEDPEIGQARDDFIAEGDLGDSDAEAAQASTSDVQVEPFVDLGVSEELHLGEQPVGIEGVSEAVEVDAGAGAERAPAATVRSEAAPMDDMGGAEVLLGLLGSPATLRGATPAAPNMLTWPACARPAAAEDGDPHQQPHKPGAWPVLLAQAS